MSTNNFFRSDLYRIHNIVQNSMIVFPKELTIATLRDFFQHDTYYHYSKDPFGFANTTDHTNLPLDAGLFDNATTRLFIGENYRFNSIFYPAILIKHGGGRYVPVSINRDKTKVQWSERTFIDGYGNQILFRHPDHFIFSGAYEGSLTIDVKTRSLRARDDLTELIVIFFTQIGYETLKRNGIICKPISWGPATESDDRNDKLFQQTLTLDIRSEWQVNEPVRNIVDVINFILEFGVVNDPTYPIDPNFTINTQATIYDVFDGILSGSIFYNPFTPPNVIT